MNKKTKTVIATIVLMMALFQGPIFYYFNDAYIKFLFLLPYALLGFVLTIYLLFLAVVYRSTTRSYHVAGVTIAFIVGICTVRGDGMEYIDFKLRKTQRMQLIEVLKNSKSGIDEQGTRVNSGNEFDIKENNKGIISIEFYIDQGFLDHYSAFLYTTDPLEIAYLNKEVASGNGFRFRKMEENWYRVGY